MIPILGKAINFKNYTPAQVITHWLPWFGTPGHIKVSYTSSDVATCDAQAAAMAVMGISGVNADYYGPESSSALACLRMLAACERTGLSFSICVDKGALGGKTTGETATQEYVRILSFLSDAFFPSTSYLRDAGRPVVTFFDEPSGVNWGVIRAAFPKIALVFKGSAGMAHPSSDGAFGWINPLPDHTDINLGSIISFTQAATASPSKLALYPVYTGFDDTLASWGQKRFMSRRGGKTLLDTLALVPKSARYALLSTWNDHEEATGVEYFQG